MFPAEGHPTRYEFSEAELMAIVEEAAARGTYVMAHVYTDEGVQRCLKAGVRSIEHGNFMTEETVARMAEKRSISPIPLISLVQRLETAPENDLPVAIVDNLKRTIDRGKQVYAWAKRHHVPIGLRHRPVGARRAGMAVEGIRGASGIQVPRQRSFAPRLR